MLRYTVLNTLLIVLGISTGLPGGDLPPDLQKKALSVLRSVDENIIRINSGICRITGETRRSNGEVIKDDIMIAFDYRRHFYRFDNGVRIRSLLTPDFYYEVWNVDQMPSMIQSSSADPRISAFADLVDVQGIFTYTPVGRRYHYAYQRFSLHKRLAGATIKPIGYSEMPNGMIKITTLYLRNDPAPPNEVVFVVDTKNDTVPHIEYSGIYVIDSSWIHINDTWVQSAYMLRSTSDIRVDWQIKWEHLNEAVDEKYFKAEDMVADIAGPVPLFAGEAKGYHQRIGVVAAEMPPFVFDSPKTTTWFDIFNRTLFILGILFVLIAVGKMTYDRWRKRNKNEP